MSLTVAQYRRALWCVVGLTFALIVFGAYVRLSDAGLGCPDWPGCYGHLSPAHAAERIADAVAQQGGTHGPVSTPKAWKEMAHRYVATVLGGILFALYCAAWGHRLRSRGARWAKAGLMGGLLAGFVYMLSKQTGLALSVGAALGLLAYILMRALPRRIPANHVGWPSALLLTVLMQGAFGAWTVTLLLKPAIVTGHLLGGLILLCLLLGYVQSLRDPPKNAAPLSRLRGFAAIGMALLSIQILLGGWVSTNYAAPACGELPQCQGQWVPPMAFHDAFHVVRELGRANDGALLSMQALTAIHWTHRMFAIVVSVYLIALAVGLLRIGAKSWGWSLLTALAIQIGLGLTVVYAMTAAHLHLPWQLPAAAAHNAGAALLLSLLVLLNFRAFRAGS